MSTIVLVIHLMVAVALIATVLLQRSEGGALGIGGGGGGGGGLMSGRGTASMLTRMTTILAGLFFLTSMGLTILGTQSTGGGNFLERLERTPGGPVQGSQGGTGGVLDSLQPSTPPSAPAAPDSQ